jgi:integrase
LTPKDKDDIFSVLDSRGKEMRTAGRISTAVTFECCLKSLKEFTGKEKFPFNRVTVKFLKDYEKWMLTPREVERKKGKKVMKENSRTTVGIYLRNVRTVFNQVKPIGVLYPFGKSKYGLYSIPKGKNTKKALTQADIYKIAAYQGASGTIEQRSRDYWLFSYLCNGINIKDMARLKYANIKGDKITLIRAKTADTVEDETTIEIMITKQIGRIIDQWGKKPASRDQFIFPILKNEMTPQDEYRAIQQAVQTINKNMENICSEIEIDRVTTYGARHSFATVLKRSGASIEFISESLGHRNKQTTQNYLANFEDAEKKKWAESLLPEKE